MKRLGIERPEFGGLDEVQQAYLATVEMMAFAPKQQEELKNPFDPRTWQLGTYAVIVGWVATVVMMAFSSGGKWTDVENRNKQLETRLQAAESRLAQDENIYARRDLLEQQMAFIVTTVNELKVKVDQLTAARAGGR